jgi:hypothetical protein
MQVAQFERLGLETQAAARGRAERRPLLADRRFERGEPADRDP